MLDLTIHRFAVITLLAAASTGTTCFAQASDQTVVARVAVPTDWRELGVGRLARALKAKTIDETDWSIDSKSNAKAIVLAFTSSTCPVSRKYAPSLARLESQYRGKDVAFIFINSSEGETAADIRAQIAEHKLQSAYVMDSDHAIATALNARTTAEAFVLDAAGTIVYRGAIDDQYSLGASLDSPRNNWLRDAIDATLAGRVPAVRATSVTGCALESPSRPATSNSEAITYHNRISRIVADNCLECHRSGGVGPFALETYAQVKARSAMMRFAIEEHLMPPWFAAPPQDGEHSPWRNDRSLGAADRADLIAWLNSESKAEGDVKDAPLARVFPNEWSIGEPDAVLEIPEPIAVKADGVMEYIHVRVPAGFEEDKWIQAIEVLPTAREVVHHVLVFTVPKDANGRRMRDSIDETRGFFAAYVPGNSAAVFPEGFARLLPANTDLIFQLHYTPNGKATTDRTRIAMKFASKPPEHVMRVVGIADRRLNIPANSDNHQESASMNVPWDVHVVAFMPHMHVRGKAFRYDIANASGETNTALEVPRYDFNWQLRYEFREPLAIKAGSKIDVTAWYDNSTNNPANPDPNKTVKWGPQTTDEMMLGYVEYYIDEEPRQTGLSPSAPSNRDLAANDRFQRLLTLFDRNGDGAVARDEVSDRFARQFDFLDSNADGKVTRDEVP